MVNIIYDTTCTKSKKNTPKFKKIHEITSGQKGDFSGSYSMYRIAKNSVYFPSVVPIVQKQQKANGSKNFI
jgi:hypothetical protein